MLDIEWKDWFDVGHERIDSEHRIFLGLVANLALDAEQGADRHKLLRTLAEIEKYAEFHFLSEENIMIDVGFPDRDRHRQLHAGLLKQFRGQTAAFSEGADTIEVLVTFLYEWFTNHTVNEDGRIADFMAGKG